MYFVKASVLIQVLQEADATAGLDLQEMDEGKCPVRGNEREPGVVAGKAISPRCMSDSCGGKRERRKER